MEITFNVLNSICRVGKQLKNSKLSARAMRHVEKDVKKIASYLDVSETQAAIFSLIYHHNYNNCESATVPDLAQYLSLDTIEMLKYNKDFLQLAEKNICVADKSRRRNNAPEFMDIHYTVNAELSEAIFDNKKIVLEKNPVAKKDLMSWLRFVGDAFAEADRDASPRIINRKLTQEEKQYKTCADVQKLNQLLPETNSRMLFYDFAYDKIFKSGESSLKDTLQDLYGYDNDSIINIGKLFIDKKHELQKMDLVELESGESFDDATIELTEKGLELVVGENIDLYRKTVSDKEMIVPEKIAEKKLFYGKETQEQIELVRSSLDGKKFGELKKRLAEKNLPEAFAFCCTAHQEQERQKASNRLRKRQTEKFITWTSAKLSRAGLAKARNASRRFSKNTVASASVRKSLASLFLFCFSMRRTQCFPSVRTRHLQMWRRQRTPSKILSWRKWRRCLAF